jgi:hypothetical protein
VSVVTRTRSPVTKRGLRVSSFTSRVQTAASSAPRASTRHTLPSNTAATKPSLAPTGGTSEPEIEPVRRLFTTGAVFTAPAAPNSMA